MTNTIELVREVVGDLEASGFEAAVFGGWAEELLCLSQPRDHMDIDLLLFDADLGSLDTFVKGRTEIGGKRFSHKRAFSAGGVTVEAFLVNGGVTVFWDRLSYRWPDADCVEMRGLRVAPRDWIVAYRRDYAAIRAASQPQHLPRPPELG